MNVSFLLILYWFFSTDFSDSEAIEEEYMSENGDGVRRSSLEEITSTKPGHERERHRKPYRRSHSLAEIRRPTHVFLPEGKKR